jgi:hypothetical protein
VDCAGGCKVPTFVSGHFWVISLTRREWLVEIGGPIDLIVGVGSGFFRCQLISVYGVTASWEWNCFLDCRQCKEDDEEACGVWRGSSGYLSWPVRRQQIDTRLA